MSTPLKARVLLADDHAMVRRGLRLILDAEPDLEVVAEAGDGAEAIELAVSEQIHLAVLDITMPRLTGLQAARELAQRRPETKILMLSMHDNEEYLFEALRAGAAGYVLKSAVDRDLVEACRATLRGETFLYPGAVTALVRAHLERGGDDAAVRPAHASRVRGRQARRRGHDDAGDRATPSSSARRRSSATAPTSSRSSGCATASTSPATRSAAASWSLRRLRASPHRGWVVRRMGCGVRGAGS